MAASQSNSYHSVSIRGLTLIEVLIALAIISIAMTAIIKATSQNIRATNYLQDKTMALWVGETVMNEARVGLYTLQRGANEQLDTRILLGRKWYLKLSEAATPNKHISKIIVTVLAHEQSQSPIITLESYLYHEN